MKHGTLIIFAEISRAARRKDACRLVFGIRMAILVFFKAQNAVSDRPWEQGCMQISGLIDPSLLVTTDSHFEDPSGLTEVSRIATQTKWAYVLSQPR
jgi:hypothetical protein